MDGAAQAVLAWGRQIADLLVPRGCAGCDRPDEALCAACTAMFARFEHWTIPRAGSPLRAHACAAYAGAARRAILAWKDHDDVELDAAMACAVAALARSTPIMPACDAAGPDAGDCNALADDRELLVVPVPSSARSVRRRGRVHVRPLADAVARGLADRGIAACVDDALAMRNVRARSVEDSSVASRRTRLDDRIAIRRSHAIAGRRVVLVDDIITTGATIVQCANAAQRAGAAVVAAFALAHTPRAGVTPDGISAA